jgi:peptide/nickel transport system ATP-binding protein
MRSIRAWRKSFDMTALLTVENLDVRFHRPDGIVHAVEDFSFHINEGEVLAVVGESGCGKSAMANSLLRLVPRSSSRISGTVSYRGADLLLLPDAAMRAIRGKEIGMIFQEPMTSLNPVLTIGRQIYETITAHEKIGRRMVRRRAVELFELVGIPEPRRYMDEYPYRLSGGLQQRVMIAIAIACNPRLLIADEPTTALDATIQAQILELLGNLKRRIGVAVLLITHDLGVVSEVAERVLVMYAGRKIEEASVKQIFSSPRHPYMQKLLGAVPKLGVANPGGRLAEIPGVAPTRLEPIVGCAFAHRCPSATGLCRLVAPALLEKAPGHLTACHYAPKEALVA